MVTLIHWPPERFEWKFRSVIFELILVIDGRDVLCVIALRWMSLDLNDDKSALVQVMAWCRQATSHYLSQFWPRYLSPYGITTPNWVKEYVSNFVMNLIGLFSFAVEKEHIKIYQYEHNYCISILKHTICNWGSWIRVPPGLSYFSPHKISCFFFSRNLQLSKCVLLPMHPWMAFRVLTLINTLRSRHSECHFYSHHFQIHFLQRKVLYFDKDWTDICFQGPSQQYTSTSSDNGLVPNRRQSITWANNGPVYWCIYAALSLKWSS